MIAGTPLAPDRIAHNAVGTERVSSDSLKIHRLELTAIAVKHGFPHPQREFSAYDRETSRYLTTSLNIYPNDAGAQDVWAHFNGWLVPHLVAWRWPFSASQEGQSEVKGFERFGLGSRWFHRNQMGRLWWRGFILGDRYWNTSIGEDQLSAVLERPSLSRNPALANAIVDAWLPYQNASGSEDLMRDAIQRIRLLLPVYALHGMEPDAVREMVGDAFEASISYLASARKQKP
jgi:Family of unknown function (DUF6339)